MITYYFGFEISIQDRIFEAKASIPCTYNQENKDLITD